MKKRVTCAKIVVATFFALLAFCLSACDTGEKTTLRFGSGNEGGVYNSLAHDFAKKVNSENKNFEIQVKRSAGSAANIRLLDEGYIDLGIVQADDLSAYLMRNRIRSAITAVAGLYTESIQIVTVENSDIKSVSDLVGHAVSLGEEESGSNRSAQIILEAYGVPTEKVIELNLNFKDAAKALKEGRIDAFFCTVGIPAPYISELAKSTKIRILSLDTLGMNRIMSLHPELTMSVIPAGTYAGQDSDVHTLGVKAVLVASRMLDSAIVESVASEVYAAGTQQTISIPVGFHPGAAAFYKSKNLNVNAVNP